MATLVDGPDIRIHGRAIAVAHQEGRDEATQADINRRDWRERWPCYFRVHHAEFVAGTLANGVSLYTMMDILGTNAFATTQARVANGLPADPRMSIRQQAHVRLSTQGLEWIHRELENAMAGYGKLPISSYPLD